MPAARPAPPVRVAIALGSNLGDRAGHLAWAGEALGEFLTELRISPPQLTTPHDVPDPQPDYLNAVAVGRTRLPARALLDRLLELEQRRGRTRPGVRAARTLDLDLVLYGDAIIDEPGLVVPHPRYRTRAFVLGPLAALTPRWRDPVTGETLQRMWKSHRPPLGGRPAG